jgi:outer membrane protein assembly factor BamB
VARRVILAAAILGVNACASTGGAAPGFQERGWRAYLGSPAHADAVPAVLGADPAPLWRARAGRGVVGAPALTEALVVLAQADRKVTVLDRRTGAVLWRRDLSANLGAGPLVDYDRVYVAAQDPDGRVFALSLAGGRTLWRARLGPVAAPLAVHDTELYAATLDGEVAALSTTGGGVLWRAHLGAAVRAAPLVAGGALYLATTADSLYRLDRGTGAVRVRRGTEGTVLAAPALADSVILVGTTSGRLEACDTATLAPRWSLALGSAVLGAVAVQRDTAFVLTAAGALWRVPLAAPQTATHLALGIVSRAGPTPVAGGVLLASVDGRVELVDGAGTVRWMATLRPPVAAPLLADQGFLLAVSERGEVVAFR